MIRNLFSGLMGERLKISISFLFLVFLIGCKGGAGKQQVNMKDRPNILFIMSDDHTSQAWGIYGGGLKDYVHTPNIRRLAKEGAVLENCFVSNSICTPSRATILTGQYSHLNGVKTLGGDLFPEQNHIAKELGKSGYQTSIIGKWHLHKEPSGFDYYCVLPGQGRYWDPLMKTKENWEDNMKGGKLYEGFSTDVITDMTIDWIEKRDKSKPFMAMCHFKAVHEPFDYPERFSHLYRDIDIPIPESFGDRGAETTGRTFDGESIDHLTELYVLASEHPEKRRDFMFYPELPFSVEGLSYEEARMKTYQKFVKDFMRSGAAVDDNIGKLMNYLDDSGLAENTIVIYTSDQGYFLGEHGMFDKRMIYEESSRMPFIIRYPKEIVAGTRNKDLIENVDFSALFADYANIPYPETMQGRSFRENLKGNTPEDWRTYTYYRYWAHSKERPGHFGIRGQRYKLAFFYGNGLGKTLEEINDEKVMFWEFYDLEKDPKELHNAYYDVKYKEVIQNLKQELKRKKLEVRDTDDGNYEILGIIKNNWDS